MLRGAACAAAAVLIALTAACSGDSVESVCDEVFDLMRATMGEPYFFYLDELDEEFIPAFEEMAGVGRAEFDRRCRGQTLEEVQLGLDLMEAAIEHAKAGWERYKDGN